MLAGYEERILSVHQIPADGRVTRDIRAAVPEAQAPCTWLCEWTLQASPANQTWLLIGVASCKRAAAIS